MGMHRLITLTTAGAALGAALFALPATSASASAPEAARVTMSQNCWSGGTHSTGGATMQYYECRRTHGGKVQTSISIRVKDTKNDGMCGMARGEIGNDAHSAYPRVHAKSCKTGGWSAWTRSGWWNGHQGYEYVYVVYP
ncbi:hypothetical protein [Streptomyces sp. NPDC052036]|uniref:hypothetical protein n=1 Tax=unclassified Streptomyces TaxID=2593676 RepID=UPI00342D4E37